MAGSFDRNDRTELMKQVDLVESTPLLSHFPVLDADDGKEGHRDSPLGCGDAEEGAAMGTTERQAVSDAVILPEDIVERELTIGEGAA